MIIRDGTPTQIQTALGLVAAATGATGGAVGVIQQIKNLVGGGKASPELDGLVNDLSQRLTAANVLNLQLSEALRSLSGQLNQENEFSVIKSRYVLTETKVGDLVLKYVLQPEDNQPEHYACPVCLGDGKIGYVSGQGHLRACQRCKKIFRFDQAPPKRPARVVGHW